MSGERREALPYMLAVALDPSEDTAHRWCDEDSGGTHRFDREAFERDVLAALAALAAEPPALDVTREALDAALKPHIGPKGRRIVVDDVLARLAREASDTGSEYGRLLAERDRLIADGVDPADLEMPLPPEASDG